MQTAPTVTKRPASINRRVYELRKRAKMTRAQLAAWLGISVSTLSRIERGLVRLSAERVSLIARLLHVSIAELYGEADEEQAA